jgi:hypothetical protein
MMNVVEEEKKESAGIRLVPAEPEEMGEMFIDTIIPYNMINDLNVAIDNLQYLTTDIEKEDSSNFHCEPSKYLEILSQIFYLIKSRFSDEVEPDGELVTYYDGPVEAHPSVLVLNKLNLLAFFTQELV